ncbi:MAG: type 1 glutamine amidotransferase [Rubrivivax sp.]
MKPVLILQHLSSDGPAYLGSWLQRQGVAFDVRDAETGQARPHDMSEHGALAVLGGEMSANDALPSLREAENLIRDAMQRGRPVIGHCLGGQLMARALGAKVIASPAPEIGWQPWSVEESALASTWFAEPDASVPSHVFQWHAEAFELPPGATVLARSAACPHQAFAIGPHLALQFHLEVDETKLRLWSTAESSDYLEQQRLHASVQSGAAMREGMAKHLDAQQRLADHVYSRWLGAAGMAS